MAVKLTETIQADQFNPTPPDLIDRMLDKIQCRRDGDCAAERGVTARSLPPNQK